MVQKFFRTGIWIFTIQIIVSPVVSLGQTIYKGSLHNNRTNEIIPYASVGLMKENIGTNADENGNFELKSFMSFPDDTLIISCLGYQVLKIKVSGFDNSSLVMQLKEESIGLKEVVVSNIARPKSDILNKFLKPSHEYTISNTQLAQHFQIKRTNAKLVGIKICYSGYGPKYKNSIYRLRIYAMDSLTKAPSYDLYDKIIEVKAKGPMAFVNLKKYKIIIPDNDFFIAIEWLKVPTNLEKELFKGEVSPSYLPIIGCTQRTEKTLEYWEFSYQNKWFLYEQGTLLMQAIIKN